MIALVSTLMLVSVASANEVPNFSFNVVPLTEDTIVEIGNGCAEMQEGYDAYALEISMSGVALDRPANALTGKMLNTTEFLFDVEGFEYIDTENSGILWYESYNYVEPNADKFTDTDKTYKIGLPAPSAAKSYPARKQTVAATDSNVLVTSVIYVRTGQSVSFSISKLSGGLTELNAGEIVGGVPYYTFNNIVNPETVTYAPAKVTLGEAAPAPSAQYFYATVEAIKDNYLEFQFDSNDDDKADLGYDYYMGTMTASKDDPLTVGLKYTGTQTLDLTKVIWSKIDHKANN